MKPHIVLTVIIIVFIAFAIGFAMAVERSKPGKFIAGVAAASSGKESYPLITVWILDTESGKIKTWIRETSGHRMRFTFDYNVDYVELERDWPTLSEVIFERVQELKKNNLPTESARN